MTSGQEPSLFLHLRLCPRIVLCGHNVAALSPTLHMSSKQEESDKQRAKGMYQQKLGTRFIRSLHSVTLFTGLSNQNLSYMATPSCRVSCEIYPFVSTLPHFWFLLTICIVDSSMLTQYWIPSWEKLGVKGCEGLRGKFLLLPMKLQLPSLTWTLQGLGEVLEVCSQDLMFL